jgi:prepilin-type N-terminal cleavage/methylation domain-containing protein
MKVGPMSRDLTRQTLGCYAGVRHLQRLHKIGTLTMPPAAGKLSSGNDLPSFVLFYAAAATVWTSRARPSKMVMPRQRFRLPLVRFLSLVEQFMRPFPSYSLIGKVRGFTLVELLVVIAIVGVVMSLLLPAVQAARESSRRASCQNNLKQIALATHLHHDALNAFPAARYSPAQDAPAGMDCGGEEATWLVRVLPYLEQGSAYEGWDLNAKWHQHPDEVREFVPQVYLCPSRRAGTRPIGTRSIGGETGATEEGTPRRLPCGCVVIIPARPLPGGAPPFEQTGALGDYAGNHGDVSTGVTGAATDFYYGGNGTGVIISVRPRCYEGKPIAALDRVRMASILDGTSNTFLIGEKFVAPEQIATFPDDSPIYDGDHLPASCRLAGPGLRLANSPSDPMADMYSFGSWHPGVVHFALVDGSVRAFAPETDTRVLGSLANRGDARVVELESL